MGGLSGLSGLAGLSGIADSVVGPNLAPRQTIFVVDLGDATSGGVDVSLDPVVAVPDNSFSLFVGDEAAAIETLINAVPDSVTDWTVVRSSNVYTFTSVEELFEEWFITFDSTDTQESTITVTQEGQVGSSTPPSGFKYLVDGSGNFIVDGSGNRILVPNG